MENISGNKICASLCAHCKTSWLKAIANVLTTSFLINARDGMDLPGRWSVVYPVPVIQCTARLSATTAAGTGYRAVSLQPSPRKTARITPVIRSQSITLERLRLLSQSSFASLLILVPPGAETTQVDTANFIKKV